MSSTEGRQSPPPETQSGSQLKDAPASGQGTDKVNAEDKKGKMEDQLKNFASNPKGPLDDAVAAKFSKTAKPSE